ncbi:MAG: hypothetical protein QOG67_342, partial [Verrucomicrobiota bacterium]
LFLAPGEGEDQQAADKAVAGQAPAPDALSDAVRILRG